MLLKLTLGPNGKNVLIFNNYGDSHLTKDGITVANNIKSDDPIVNGVINVVREASANNAKSVGDGTTSTLVLTQAIFNSGIELLEEGANPTLLKEGMDEALKDILIEIEKSSEKININDNERLKQIAYISANNKLMLQNQQLKLSQYLEYQELLKLKILKLLKQQLSLLMV